MGSLLRSLYRGDIAPEARHIQHSDAYRTLIERVETEESYVVSKLSTEDGLRFIGLKNLYAELDGLDSQALFAYSFSLGVMLALEIQREVAPSS